MDKTEFIRAETRSRSWAQQLTEDQIESFVRLFNEVWGNLSEAEIVRRIDKALGGQQPENAQVIAEVISQNYTRPNNYLMLTPKAVKTAFDGKTDLTEGGQRLRVSPKKQKNAYIVPMELYPPEIGQKIYLDRTDRQILNGIATMIEHGNGEFTIKQIYEASTGKELKDTRKITDWEERIRRMRQILINIDWTEHARMNGLSMDNPGDYVVSQENFLSLRYVKIRTNGQEREGYQLLDFPPLYRYAKAVEQLQQVEMKYLDLPVSNTDSNLALRDELLERIETMKKPRKKKLANANNISFDTLYKVAGIPDDAKQKERTRKAVFAMLDAWKQQGLFRDYAQNKSGRQVISVTIEI